MEAGFDEIEHEERRRYVSDLDLAALEPLQLIFTPQYLYLI